MPVLPTKSSLAWQCRRGLLELDLVLGRFLNDGFEQLTPAEKLNFAMLLAHSDPDLYQWLVGQTPCPDAHLRALLIKIQTYRKSTK